MPERYEFIRKVAQGGFGRVYVARDTRLGREVAIKRLLEGEHTDAQNQAEEVFRREAMTLASMQHPNIVQIFDFDRDEEGSFVVMELLSGETLKERLDRGALSWDTFVKAVRESLEAIGAAHSKGILHRDLKPENLYLNLTPSGTRVVKILDFGLAKLSQAPSKQTMDQQGNVFGSIYYMAPEQFRRESLDARTDLYALGCVYYQALTQRFPFFGEKVYDTMEAHLQHQVKPLRERRKDINPAVADWVMRLISLKPADRPADAMEALRQFEQALSGPAAVPVLVEPVKEDSVQTKPVAPLPPSARSGVITPPARPTGAVTSGGLPGAAPMRAVSALEASRADARAKLEATARRNRLIAMVAVPVVGLIAVVAILNRKSLSSSAPTGPATQPAPAGNTAAKPPSPPVQGLPGPVLLTLPMEDFLAWRFRGGVEMWHRGGNGNGSNAKPGSGQKVHYWRNIADPSDNGLRPYENKQERGGAAFAADVRGEGTKHPYVYVSGGSGMESRLPSSRLPFAPGGAQSSPKGATMAAVFRANGGSKEPVLRLAVLSPANDLKETFSLHFSHRVGQYWAIVQHGGQMAQSLLTPEVFRKRKDGAGGSWVAAVTVWNADQGTVQLRVRDPDGKVTLGPVTPLPKGMPVLERLNLGLVNLPKEGKLDPKQKMDGDIVEFALYRQALDEATQTKLLNALWDRYFLKR